MPRTWRDGRVRCRAMVDTLVRSLVLVLLVGLFVVDIIYERRQHERPRERVEAHE